MTKMFLLHLVIVNSLGVSDTTQKPSKVYFSIGICVVTEKVMATSGIQGGIRQGLMKV